MESQPQNPEFRNNPETFTQAEVTEYCSHRKPVLTIDHDTATV